MSMAKGIRVGPLHPTEVPVLPFEQLAMTVTKNNYNIPVIHSLEEVSVRQETFFFFFFPILLFLVIIIHNETTVKSCWCICCSLSRFSSTVLKGNSGVIP